MQQPSSRTKINSVLTILIGDDCSWCPTGTLVHDEFKGDNAVVCQQCGTPAARVW